MSNLALAIPAVLDGARSSMIDEYSLHQAVRCDLQVPPRPCRIEVRDGCAATATLALRDLIVAHAFLARAVEIVVERQADGYARGDERIGERIAAAQIFHRERAVGAVIDRRAVLLPLRFAEVGENVLVVPARCTAAPEERRAIKVIARLAT